MPFLILTLTCGLMACRSEPGNTKTGGVISTGIQHPNLLLLVPDTLRGDRVESRSGGSCPPNLQRLAQRGTRFTQARSQAGWTWPALATLLTGRYPLLPRDQFSPLHWIPPQQPTIAQILALHDYHTVAFFGANASFLGEEYARGFQQVVGAQGQNRVPGLADEVAAWLRDAPPEPFFALVHDVDLQFVASQDDLASYPGAIQHLRQRPGKGSLPPGEKPAIAIQEMYEALLPGLDEDATRAATTAAYDATVSTWADGLGQMMDALEVSGLSSRTTVVLTSLHGVHLGEHQRFTHGSLLEPDLHIPLVWLEPNPTAPGTAEATPVQLADLAPSLLARTGVPLPPGLVGQSLLSLLHLGDIPYTPSDHYALNNRRDMALVHGHLKLIREQHLLIRPGQPPDEGPEQHMLFDLSRDPHEDNALSPDDVPAAKAMQERLAAFYTARLAESTAQDHLQQAPHDDTLLRQVLKERGYWSQVQGGDSPTAHPPAPSGWRKDESPPSDGAQEHRVR